MPSARYKKVHEAGVVMDQAVLIAVGIDWDGRRQILAVGMAGLVVAIGEVIGKAARQRCYADVLRRALDHVARRHGDDCVQKLRWLYDRRDLAETKSCLRRVRAGAVEPHENWLEANRHINMDDLREHKKLALRQAA